jgi:hypothetical protein
MQVPLRLTAEIFKAKMARMIRGDAGASLILHLRAPVSADSEDGAVLAQEENAILARVQASASPVAWFGASEPLLYSGLGHLARRIVDLGRTVFVETDGVLLRRHVFSFRPVAQLFLVVQLNGTESAHDRRAGREGLWRTAMEGIRAARLSGFMVCAKTKIFENTTLEEIRKLRTVTEELDLDGWVITCGEQTDAVRKMVVESRETAGRSWGNFSRMVELSEAELASQGEDTDADVFSDEEPEEEVQEGVSVQ